ncbi:MAG: exopolysaccharide biosynthesis polyprenyl glycosylphosphotransferase [Dehalococcoidia bacterium]
MTTLVYEPSERADIAFPPEWDPGFRLSPAWRGWQRYAKRSIDMVGAAALLALLLPVLGLIALAIRLDSPGGVIFRQTRSGKGGRPFKYYKFRGMVADAEARKAELEALNEADGPIFKIRNDPRVTRVGRIIRRTSLDELPQLWSVLRGDMSLVGPRPPIPAEVQRYEPWHVNRLTVVGGMTGLWQVSGRSDLSFDEMVRLDLDYIATWSLWLDIRILLRTFGAVISSTGAY